MELVDQTGRLLARKVVGVETAIDEDLIELEMPIYFEVSHPSVGALLILSLDDEYGRLKALDSIEVTLLSAGENLLLANETLSHIEIESPNSGEILEGGSLVISGQSSSQPGRPLSIELITRAGRVLVFGEVYPRFDDGSQVGTFSITLNYELEQSEWVLIAVAERKNGVTIHYASLEVLLQPAK